VARGAEEMRELCGENIRIASTIRKPNCVKRNQFLPQNIQCYVIISNAMSSCTTDDDRMVENILVFNIQCYVQVKFSPRDRGQTYRQAFDT